MINHVVLVGRLTKDPIFQPTSTGKKAAFINLATTGYSEHLKKVVTNFVSIKLWGQTAEYALNKAKKGMEVTIEGLVRTSSFVTDQEKQKYVTEIVVEKLHILNGQFEETSQNDKDLTSSEFEQFVKALE